ncbi:MAG: nitroreductase family protein [Dehalococcoidia bacterium]|nr:nitroreductase family protein [Dehalococcoidia bacterium]
MTTEATEDRLSMPLGEVMFGMRAIRRLKPDPVADEDIRSLIEAAIQAPSPSNRQPWHFLVVRDAEQRRRFGEIYRRAWWAKRADAGIHGPEDIPAEDRVARSAMRMADEFGQAPAVILVCATSPSVIDMTGVIPATQNLLLAARALGLGATITNMHPSVVDDVRALFDMPEGARVIYAVPVGYPRGKFGPVSRKPLAEATSQDRWGQPLA